MFSSTLGGVRIAPSAEVVLGGLGTADAPVENTPDWPSSLSPAGVERLKEVSTTGKPLVMGSAGAFKPTQASGKYCPFHCPSIVWVVDVGEISGGVVASGHGTGAQ